MPWTLRDLMSEATAHAKLTSDDIQPSRVSFYVNAAQRDVANRIQQAEFERLAVSSMSSGEARLFLPTDCERVLNLSFDTGSPPRNIEQQNVWDFDNKSSGTQTGTPRFYVSYATWVEFYPSPNSSYSLLLRYVGRLSDITNLDSIPSIDTRYHQAVLFKTVSYLAHRSGNENLAGRMDGWFEREMAAQPSVIAQRQLNKTGAHCRVQLDGLRSTTRVYDFDQRDT